MIFQVTISDTRNETRVFVAEGADAMAVIRKGRDLFEAAVTQAHDAAADAAVKAGKPYVAPVRAPIAEVHLSTLPVSGMFTISNVVPFGAR